MVQKPSLAKQLNPLRFLEGFLPLSRSPSSSLLLEHEVEYVELELTSLVKDRYGEPERGGVNGSR
jgi:hypothetical protein